MVAYQNIDRSSFTEAGGQAAREALARLKGRIAGLETDSDPGLAALSTGVERIDEALPWAGLPLAGLHEVAGWREADFALALLAGLLARPSETRPVLWCQSLDAARERGRPYGPGLAQRGADPGRMLFVTARRERECLWAMEEALASGAVAAAVAEAPAIGMTETRRLQLAAARGEAMGLILRGPVGDRAPSAALTRWRAEPLPGPESAGPPPLTGPGRFDLSLWRCRGGAPDNWTVEQDAQTLHLALAAPLAGRASATA
jgi:protein ImuA